MKAITMYEADDGSLWRTAGEAETRDAEICEADDLYDLLGLRRAPSSTDFLNGGGYIQQPAGSREALLAWLKEKGAHRDSVGPVGKVLSRMYRLDDRDREWGQAYFANNPHKGKQVEWFA